MSGVCVDVLHRVSVFGGWCTVCGVGYGGPDEFVPVPDAGPVVSPVPYPVGPNPPAPGRNGRWELLGEVGVDSASVAVTDLLSERDVSLDAPYLSDRVGAADSRYAVPGSRWAGDYGTGVRFWAGFGDGGYRVWGWVVDYGEDSRVDERVAQVVITMIDQAELDEWRS